jgi:hypothetical protein
MRSRRIVGWSMAATLASQLVLDALNMALATRRPAGVIHHSDRRLLGSIGNIPPVEAEALTICKRTSAPWWRLTESRMMRPRPDFARRPQRMRSLLGAAASTATEGSIALTGPTTESWNATI